MEADVGEDWVNRMTNALATKNEAQAASLLRLAGRAFKRLCIMCRHPGDLPEVVG